MRPDPGMEWLARLAAVVPVVLVIWLLSLLRGCA